ncbi:MAG TPA: GtrA family protein [Streptosporangiaceae bacterium]|jgi:putative flippase GtrA|nr:GtrA family protein [Streptosporangiaceae bacterium]
MRFAPGPRARYWFLAKEAARFCVVGLSGLALTDCGANLLRYKVGLSGLVSFAIATVVATALTYIASRYWTFRHRERAGVGRETAAFFAVNAIGILISEGCIELTYLMHGDSGLAYNLALNGGAGLASVFRYWSYKNLVWRDGATTRAAQAREGRQPRVRLRRPPWPARLSPERVRRLAHELPRFGVVGTLALTVTGVGTDMLHFRAGAGPLESNVIATVAATALSFAGNRHWTFRHREQVSVSREGLLFFGLNGAALAIQLAVLGFATYLLGWHDRVGYNVALVTGIALGALFRFWSYRTLVWPAPPSRAPDRSLIGVAAG